MIRVDGMHCGHCVEGVREALAAIPGVTVEEVRIGLATVRVDETATETGALIDAIYNAGYEAQEAP
jgi:copper chaperone CopZ